MIDFFKSETIKTLLRSMSITLVVIFCISFVYLGSVKAYEEIRKICFDDHRAAVIIDSNYIKLFDMVYFFGDG